jgi:hypothetical protein
LVVLDPKEAKHIRMVDPLEEGGLVQESAPKLRVAVEVRAKPLERHRRGRGGALPTREEELRGAPDRQPRQHAKAPQSLGHHRLSL